MSSKRLPGKVLMQLGKYKVIELLYKRLLKSKKVNKIIVATTKNNSDGILCEFLKKSNIDYFRGEENNVLKRFIDLSKKYKPNYIIRITADCPLVDFRMLDNMITLFEQKKIDYLSNSHPPTFPDGLDIEIFTYQSLIEANKKAKFKYEKEHVTTIIKNNKKLIKMNYENDINLSKYRWTLDEQLDYILLNKIFEKLNNKVYFSWKDILNLEKNSPDLFICGHSHILKVMYDKNREILHLNPGAAGNYGIHKVITMLRFDIEKGEVKNLEVIEFNRH